VSDAELKGWLAPVTDIAKQAGAAILAVYNSPETLAITDKADDSPLTAADLASHKVIEQGLIALTPGIPVMSEESTEKTAWETRRAWTRYWLVDPLDGTKEFIKRNGEFTVNIALIENGVPVLGVVFVPVTGVTYAGCRGEGAFIEDAAGRRVIRARKLAETKASGEPLTIVASRSHAGERMPALLARIEKEFGAASLTSIGSSLKICMVAEGKADHYPRLGPTSEWDTAAAQAVVEAAGGHLVGANLEPLRYNSKESVLNPDFHVLGDDVSRWQWLKEFA
jgi:3'(2'), 5'-bisphosphate nucleotidase